MKEEKELQEKWGKSNPFTVPEGYFDRFAEELMEKLPEKAAPTEKEISLWEKIKPWAYMTAMFCGLMFSIRVIVGERPAQAETGETETFSELPDEYLDPIMDMTMMDDYELYQYLTDADAAIYN